nr:hypothetical protein [Tanacetum cinerariifolium]
MSSNTEVTYCECKVHPSDDGSQPMCELYLDELTLGVTGVITLMICRSWDVHTLTGRYVITDFGMSDAKGNAIHSSAKANVAHKFLKLKEGLVYCLKKFVVQSNKEEYRIFRDHTYIIELDGVSSVRKASVKSGGFVRYPFQLIPLGSIELTNNRYLIDVAGYVTNVGQISHQKSGSRTLDFSLANGSEQAIRVTLWGALADTLVERKTNKAGLYLVVLTSMNVKLYSSKELLPLCFWRNFQHNILVTFSFLHFDKLYLSRSYFTQILDDPQIPSMHALLSENSEDKVSLSQAITIRYFREQELREQEQASQEKEKPPQNSDFRQLIGEICSIKVCEEQKQNMEDTMLKLLEVCRQKELYCMHNDVDDVPQDYDASSATPCLFIHSIYVIHCLYIRSLSVMLSRISFHILYGSPSVHTLCMFSHKGSRCVFPTFPLVFRLLRLYAFLTML